MITYTQMGNMGRLGNQMFQYAALYGTAFIRGFEFSIPEKDLAIRDVFKLPSTNFHKEVEVSKRYSEPAFSFAGNIWLIEDDTDLFGYFQSPNYFLHCQKMMAEEFEFHDHIQDAADDWLKKWELQDKPLCSIHVRRGDYLNLSNYHYNLDINDYYRKAYNHVSSNIKDELSYIIFSDDPEWCKKNFPGALVSEGNSEGVDMCLMAKSHVHIIANSSFSWWGATLSGSGAVVAPNNWFGPEGPKDTNHLYWPHWIRL